jgi:hypothetical protein
MVKVTLSKLDNLEDTRTITLSVPKFLELDLADTEDNARKIEQVKEEDSKLHSPFRDLVQCIKPFLACCPAPCQHGASMWRWICRPFTMCISTQRRSENISNASITSMTNLCSPTIDLLSPGSEKVRYALVIIKTTLSLRSAAGTNTTERTRKHIQPNENAFRAND